MNTKPEFLEQPKTMPLTAPAYLSGMGIHATTAKAIFVQGRSAFNVHEGRNSGAFGRNGAAKTIDPAGHRPRLATPNCARARSGSTTSRLHTRWPATRPPANGLALVPERPPHHRGASRSRKTCNWRRSRRRSAGRLTKPHL